VIENGSIVTRTVEIGLKGEDDWEVVSGLAEGDVVVLSPDNDIEDGMKVKIKQVSEGGQ
jgi:HlyD family secretion protein